MSVLLETSLGELVIDLEVERCPRTCENFLKLCKVKYYTLNAFFNGKFGLVPPDPSVQELYRADRRPDRDRQRGRELCSVQ